MGYLVKVNPSGSSPHRLRLAQRLAYADAFEMKHQGRASLSGIVVVELVSGRRVVVSPDDLPRLGALPPIASVRLAFESGLFPRPWSSVRKRKANPLRVRSLGR